MIAFILNDYLCYIYIYSTSVKAYINFEVYFYAVAGINIITFH